MEPTQIESIKKLARKKVAFVKILKELEANRADLLKTSSTFDPENPLHRLPSEPMSAHKAFMDFAMFGGENFMMWARFRFPASKNKHLVNRTNEQEILEAPSLKVKFGDGTEWTHLSSYRKCCRQYRYYRWKDRVTAWSDICMNKLIQQKQAVDVDQKIEIQKKMYEDLMSGVLAASREAVRRLVEDLKSDPTLKLSIKDLVSLGKFAVQENQVINPKEAPAKNEKTLVQNNYHFGDIASMVHDDIKDI